MTDMMVDPASLDAFMEANPLPAEQPRVKPLVWGPYHNPVFAGPDIAVARVMFNAPILLYQVQRDPWGPGFMAFAYPEHGSEVWSSKGHADLEAAKAAAQADYDARILSALEPAVQRDAAAIREAALREALAACAAKVDQMRQISRRANNANKLRHELETDGAFEILAVLAGMIDNTGKEVMPDDQTSNSTHTRPDIGPGDQAVAGAAQKEYSHE
jgi:hypothetical protein